MNNNNSESHKPLCGSAESGPARHDMAASLARKDTAPAGTLQTPGAASSADRGPKLSLWQPVVSDNCRRSFVSPLKPALEELRRSAPDKSKLSLPASPHHRSISPTVTLMLRTDY